MKNFKSYISEGRPPASHSFKNFKDPWAVMSPEDRKEANRLTKLIFKAMPGSQRQKELQAKRNELFVKYGIGQKVEEDWSKDIREVISESRTESNLRSASCLPQATWV